MKAARLSSPIDLTSPTNGASAVVPDKGMARTGRSAHSR